MKTHNKPKIPVYLGKRVVYNMPPGHGLIQRTYDTLWAMQGAGIRKIYHAHTPFERLILEFKK